MWWRWEAFFKVQPESKFQSCPEVVWLVRRECTCLAVEWEYVGIMQCSFSLVMAVVIAQHLEKMAAHILFPPTARFMQLSDFRSNLQQRSTANCGKCMDPTIWSDNGADKSLNAKPMCNEDCSGQPSLVMPEVMESMQQAVLQNWFFTISELTGQSDNCTNFVVGRRQY